MDVMEVMDAGGTLEQVLLSLNTAAHSNVDITYGRMKDAELLANMPQESLWALQEVERAFRVRRQRVDINSARRRGVAFGRPVNSMPENYAAVMEKFLQGELSGLKAATELGMPYSTFMWRARKERKRREVE